MTVGILDTVFLDRLQKSWKKQAAQIQEKLTARCSGYRGIMQSRAGVDSEDVIAAAAAYSRYRNPERLKRLVSTGGRWPAAPSGSADLSAGQLLVDSSLRKRRPRALLHCWFQNSHSVRRGAGSHTRAWRASLLRVTRLLRHLCVDAQERHRQLDARDYSRFPPCARG